MDRINLLSTAVSLVALAFIVYTCNPDPELSLEIDVGKTLTCLKECNGKGEYSNGMCICIRNFDKSMLIDVSIDDEARECYVISEP
jgi:hypothetical protein